MDRQSALVLGRLMLPEMSRREFGDPAGRGGQACQGGQPGRNNRWKFGRFGSVGKEVADGVGLVDVGEPRRLGVVS